MTLNRTALLTYNGPAKVDFRIPSFPQTFAEDRESFRSKYKIATVEPFSKK